MIKIKYNSINWPVTLQNYITDYSDELYEQLFEDYTFRFDLNITFDYTYNKDHSFILNKTAFVIFDKNKKQIIKYAFVSLVDFIWILNMININSLVIELEDNIYKQIQKDLEIYISNGLLTVV